MNLYSIIDKRRSVRQFTDKLSDNILTKLNSYINESLEVLIDDIKYTIKIVDKDKVKANRVDAPQYILFYSERKEGYQLNAGFIMQQLDLLLQAEGAGSCWLGIATPINKKLDGLDYVIMLAIGMTNKLLRVNADEFKRKSLEEVGNLDNKKAINAIRLAPSAVNCQPWFYEQVSDDLIEVRLRRKILQKIILNSFDYIDIGISICHCLLAYREDGKTILLKTKNICKKGTITLQIKDLN